MDRKRARYQEMAADDLITFDELRARLAELDDIRSLAERELKALRNHEELICKLEADRDALLESLVGVAQDALGLPYGRRAPRRLQNAQVESNRRSG